MPEWSAFFPVDICPWQPGLLFQGQPLQVRSSECSQDPVTARDRCSIPSPQVAGSSRLARVSRALQRRLYRSSASQPVSSFFPPR